MPLSATRLAALVEQDLQNQGFKFDTKEAPFPKALIESLCTRVLEEIKTNGLVTGPVAVTSVAGVITGPSASGPGAGTLTAGTIA